MNMFYHLKACRCEYVPICGTKVPRALNNCKLFLKKTIFTKNPFKNSLQNPFVIPDPSGIYKGFFKGFLRGKNRFLQKQTKKRYFDFSLQLLRFQYPLKKPINCLKMKILSFNINKIRSQNFHV